MGFIAGLISGVIIGFCICTITECESKSKSVQNGFIRIDGKTYALTELRWGRDHE